MPPLVSQRVSTSAPPLSAASSTLKAHSGVGLVAVEEMLGVENYLFAVRLKIAHGIVYKA